MNLSTSPQPTVTAAPASATATTRKTRCDSKLLQLDATQRARLRFWLEEEHYSYRQAADRVHKEFGISVGKSAIGVFWRRYVLPEHFDTEQDAALAFASLPPADFDTATLRRAKALAWSELSSPLPRIDTVAKLLEVALRVERQAITHQRLALEERRVALREKIAAHPPRRSRATPAEKASPLSARHATIYPNPPRRGTPSSLRPPRYLPKSLRLSKSCLPLNHPLPKSPQIPLYIRSIPI